MDYSLETLEDKLSHLKTTLWDLEREQKDKGNTAMAYVLEHLTMIAGRALNDNAFMITQEDKCLKKEQ